MIIREARREDAETIVANNCAIARETESRELDAATVSSGLARMFDQPDRGLYLVAEDEGQVIGQLMVTWEWSEWRDGQFWWIQSVYVSPDHRGRGVFQALFQAAKEMAEASGEACGIRLYHERDNTRAQRTYERLGFEDTVYRMMELPLKRSQSED